jgi:hypothetical protein
MEQYFMKHLKSKIMAISLLVGFLSGMPVGLLLAAGASDPTTLQAVEKEAPSNLREGSFDGYDPKGGVVWVDDMTFKMADNFKVIGTSKKLGLLSDVKQGEPVILLFEERGYRKIPLAIELRRQ